MVKILICGDFAPRRRILNMLLMNNFSFFNEIKKITSLSDYSILNLEAPVVIRSSKPILKTGPSLKGPINTIFAIKYAGFGGVTLANNHFRDYGQIGVEDTIDTLVANEVDYVGAGKNIKDSKRILIKTINNTKIAFLNYCENEWSVANYKHGGCNPLNPTSNYYDILEAKQEADHVIIIVHGGVEHYSLPTPRMKEWYRFFIDCGADAVVNHHQHCISGFEVYKNKPIFYGLGNFCFDMENATNSWCRGYMVNLYFEKDDVSFQLIPYEQCTNDNVNVRIIQDKKDFNNEIKNLNEIVNNYENLCASFNHLCEDGIKRFSSIMLPYRNRYMKALALRGYLPQFMSQKKLKHLRAYTSCESYYECLTNYLNQMLNF